VGDYSKTTWVEGVTQTGPTNLNKLEQGVADATKQASMDAGTAFDGTTATTNDKKRITWRRTSDGSYMASVEGYESGSGATQVTTVKDRVEARALTAGAKVQRILEATSWNAAGASKTDIARIIMEAIAGNGGSVRVETKGESGSDPSFSLKLLGDDGSSDWVRIVQGTYAARPAAITAYKNQFYYATDTKALYLCIDGASWTQISGPQEASSITTIADTTALSNGWSIYNHFRYWVDPLGYAHIIGELNCGTKTAGTAIWTLPTAMRPLWRSYFWGTMGGSGAAGAGGVMVSTTALQVSDEGAMVGGTVIHLPHMVWPTFV
jgi:hypothetical protein